MSRHYLATQVAVYRHLLTRHAQDPTFRFSLRRQFAATPVATQGLFIGTARSRYFAFTLWHIPVGFPGSAMELISYIIRVESDGSFRLKAEVLIPREGPVAGEPGWHPNTLPGRGLVAELQRQTWPDRVHWHAAPATNKMLQLTYHATPYLHDVADLLTALDAVLDDTIPGIDNAIAIHADHTPGWIAHRYTEVQFAQMRVKAELRCAGILAGIFPDDEQLTPPVPPEPTYWCTQVDNDPQAWPNFQQQQEVRPLFGHLLAATGSGDGSKRLSEAQPGDVVVVSQGPRRALGVGILTDHFTTDEQHPPHTCPVKWMLTTPVELTGTPFVTGSMVWNETHQWAAIRAAYAQAAPAALAKLEALLAGEDPSDDSDDNVEPEPEPSAYWWLNMNPSVWKVADFEVGQEQIWTTRNEKGNPRNIYAHFLKVQPGDLVVGYETTPTKRIRAILEITEAAHVNEDNREVITLRVKEFVREELTLKQLHQMPELASAEPLKGSQGSLFKLTPTEFGAIQKRAQRIEAPPLPTYTLAEAEQDLFLTTDEIKHLQTALKRKMNLIVQGPPGVGKTYVARRLAWLHMREKDDSRVQLVQFHQSYNYEDFIRGWRPTAGGAFELANGVFVDFVRRAQHDQAHDYFFIIDEINRGNLSKIFGELLMLLEADKRDPQYALPLTYRKPDEAPFYLPPNLFVIGTMNTADRSLALVDYALRRRFTFVDLVPRLDDKLAAHLQHAGVPVELANTLLDRVQQLNQQIVKDRNLGPGFQIGHSYFCVPLNGEPADAWWHDIVAHDLAPLLREYWFDDLEGKKAANAVAALLGQNPAT
jgi:5-methylcytosine-specific restriction enzyme B